MSVDLVNSNGGQEDELALIYDFDNRTNCEISRLSN